MVRENTPTGGGGEMEMPEEELYCMLVYFRRRRTNSSDEEVEGVEGVDGGPRVGLEFSQAQISDDDSCG